ncbi:hypothetical protein H0I76_13155 [Limibaculum sp. M0105]|uniref:Uncharacterized protein n=1 Tax=Thermohalobaculum xanthum TaxID=2753746 RepID=A0A8J7M993_9RHOB|nr:hypothetical protein [Thermohalobaculum xanthum]MBK0400140.1 hypothetical protein [Thermohalobaculum xanthum]
MIKTLTGRYDHVDKARNAMDDLIGTGIPREKLYFDEKANCVKVITPGDTEREVREILGRHEPVEVIERAMD